MITPHAGPDDTAAPWPAQHAAGDPTAAALAAIGREVGSAPEDLERCETHLSIVVLAADRAFKVLRPLQLPFVDHRTVDGRAATCRAELRLNAALAPGVYRAVRSVVVDPSGARLVPDGDPAAVEHVVEMRRFDEAETLAARLVSGRGASDGELDGLARSLVAFHDAASRVPRDDAAAAAGTTVTSNVDELLALPLAAVDRDAVRRAHRRLRAVVETAPEAFVDRAHAGWVRELHGDLRAEHVVIEPARVLVVDALEFSQELRRIDVADELAFLAMDLEALGHPDVADRVIAAYRRAGGDPGPRELRAFYGAHRAFVRAKVAVLRGRSAESGDLCRLAERLAHRAMPPVCVVVHGPSGSGKSVLADRLAERTGVPVVSSDVVRKTSHGLERTTRAPEAVYAPEVTVALYAELGRRAAEHLRAGGSVVVDATCNDRAARDALRDGLASDAPRMLWVSCAAPKDVLRERVARRLLDPSRTSDATVAVLERQLSSTESPDEIPPEERIVVRTDAPTEHALDLVDAAVELRSAEGARRP